MNRLTKEQTIDTHREIERDLNLSENALWMKPPMHTRTRMVPFSRHSFADSFLGLPRILHLQRNCHLTHILVCPTCVEAPHHLDGKIGSSRINRERVRRWWRRNEKDDPKITPGQRTEATIRTRQPTNHSQQQRTAPTCWIVHTHKHTQTHTISIDSG